MRKIELESNLPESLQGIAGIIPAGIVYKTSDHSIFKKMEGNRDLHKMASLKKSIKEKGYLMQPICVNKDMEIADGQNRQAVCEDLGIPVYFVIDPDVKLDEAISLNIGQKNWAAKDYITAYEAKGLADYQRLAELCRLFPAYNWKTIMVAAGRTLTGGGLDKSVKNGTLKFSNEEYERGAKVMKGLDSYADDIKRFKFYGNKQNLQNAIIFAMNSKSVVNDRLRERFNKYGDSIERHVGDMYDAVKKIEEIYNRNARTNRVHLELEYKEAVEYFFGQAPVANFGKAGTNESKT